MNKILSKKCIAAGTAAMIILSIAATVPVAAETTKVSEVKVLDITGLANGTYKLEVLSTGLVNLTPLNIIVPNVVPPGPVPPIPPGPVPPGPTPVPTQLILAALPETISIGGKSNLIISAKTATVTITTIGGTPIVVKLINTGTADSFFGSVTVSPVVTTIYTATDTNGIKSQCTVTVGTDPDPPIPGDLSFLIIEETANRTPDMTPILMGRGEGTLRGYIGSKLPTISAGTPIRFRHIDPEQVLSLDTDSWVQASAQRPRTSLPWLVATTSTGTIDVPVDNQTLTRLISKFGQTVATATVPQVDLKGRLVFDDNNYKELLTPPTKNIPGVGVVTLGTGLRPRSQHPYYARTGSVPGTRLFSNVLTIIPRTEWPARIKAMDTAAAWPTDYCDFVCRDQANTNFCWANGPAACVDIVRRQMGQPFVETSAASVACKLNGFVNEGGWGTDALKYFASTGGCASKLWPNAAISRTYDNSTTMADRINRKALEWIELDGTGTTAFNQLASALLLGHPVAVGYNWWRHEVTATRLVALPGDKYGVEIRNSWGTWGDKNRWGLDGFSILSESKATPDDAFLLRSVTDSPYAQAL